jgi:DNA repair protein RadC
MFKKLGPAESSDADTVPYTAVSKPPKANPRRGARISCSEDVYQAMFDLRDSDREHFVAFDLDARHRLICRRIVHIGSLTGVEVHPREIFRGALINSAAAIIVSHNHPSGEPSPSGQDIQITSRLREVGDLVGITVLDHVVVAADGFVSLRDRGWA